MSARLFVIALLLLAALADKRYVVQLTDQHFDFFYDPLLGAANCNQLIDGTKCCRATSLALLPKRPGTHGDYACDSSYSLVYDTMKWIKTWMQNDEEIGKKVDFMLWTGDNPSHALTQTILQTKLELGIVTGSFAGVSVPVYPALGNHEAFPTDQLSELTGLPLFAFAAEQWDDWLDDAATASLSCKGYYTMLAQPGLRIISLETTWYDTVNFLITNRYNINGQDTWLESTLAAARIAQEKVWIIGHIHPGSFRPQDSVTYQRIISGYTDIIKAQIFGHTHSDQFKLLHDVNASGNPVTGVAYIAPSIMPDDQDPAFRVYEYDNVTFEITDYITYHESLPQSNIAHDVNYQEIYRAKALYGLADLSPASWWDLTNNMKTNDKYTKYLLYKSYKIGNVEPAQPAAGLANRQELCTMKYALDEHVTKCKAGDPAYN